MAQQKKQNTVKTIKAIFKGVGETFGLVLLGKQVKTDFVPKEEEPREPAKKEDTDVPPLRVPNGMEIVIDKEYQEQIIDFIRSHDKFSTLEVPCFVNGHACSAAFCALPRVIVENNVPTIHEVAHVVFQSDFSGMVVAGADYGAGKIPAAEEFQQDIIRLEPVEIPPAEPESDERMPRPFSDVVTQEAYSAAEDELESSDYWKASLPDYAAHDKMDDIKENPDD